MTERSLRPEVESAFNLTPEYEQKLGALDAKAASPQRMCTVGHQRIANNLVCVRGVSMVQSKSAFRYIPVCASHLAVIGLAAGSLAVGTLVGSTPASASSESQCSPSVAGAPFNYKAVGGKQIKGDTYNVLVINESCSKARPWVTKLTHASPGTSTPDGARKLSGGPSGWTCEGKGYTYATRKPPTISGQCYRGKLTDPTKLFYWTTNVT